ncbi:GntR family transcriptional regulator [Xanthobacter sp. TB0136]|uniref:GntR family transcriptional regulator n=1 Tax=Xanthobacter sp. TB0136 TaxID=3459177 RepID=UPI0040399C3D
MCRKKKLYEIVHETLARAIRSSVFPPGTVILEGPVAGRLNVSRAPVRQALAMIEKDGLAHRFGGRGLIVGPVGTLPDRTLLDQVLDLIDLPESHVAFSWQTFINELEATIIYQAFFGAVRINEVELARHYGVSRSSARDALLHLEPLGLVEKDSSLRWIVVPLSTQRILELYRLRELLEPEALRLAVPHIPPLLVDAMIKRHETVLDRYPAITAGELYELELDLHVRCLDFCSNTTFVDVLRRTQCLLALSKQIMGIRIDMPEYEPFMQEHIRIFLRIRARDEIGAELALRDHIQASASKVEERAAIMRRRYVATPHQFFQPLNV